MHSRHVTLITREKPRTRKKPCNNQKIPEWHSSRTRPIFYRRRPSGWEGTCTEWRWRLDLCQEQIQESDGTLLLPTEIRIWRVTYRGLGKFREFHYLERNHLTHVANKSLTLDYQKNHWSPGGIPTAPQENTRLYQRRAEDVLNHRNAESRWQRPRNSRCSRWWVWESVFG